MKIKVLDCTLRDGGYVNDFSFGDETVKQIIEDLSKSGVDYIEVGFLRNNKDIEETTVYTDVQQIRSFLPQRKCPAKLFAMIVFGKYDIEKLPPKSQAPIDGIRVTFKKHEIVEALQYIKQVQEKGYIVSANPTGIHAYSDEELLSLIKQVNFYKPDIFAIVDTVGVLKHNELLRLFFLVDNNLDRKIAVAFHSHNNLQLSFSNAQVLLEANSKRALLIDTSVRGMGRGAGNLCTELLLQYLNDNFDRKYNLIPILKIIDEQINKIYTKFPWGYNVPYYLAASMCCHPNYASFLVDKASISVESISEILSIIPENKRANYDEKLIQELYLRYQENEVDDSLVIKALQAEIIDRDVLVLAPGKSVVSFENVIKEYIAAYQPFVISINFRPQNIRVDKVFISNAKRFSEQSVFGSLILTSNIKSDKALRLNYGSYLNNSDMPDNSALMLLKVLMKIGVKNVALAGMDGFSKGNDNYFSVDMINNAKLGEVDRRNEIMSRMLKIFSRQIGIKFITPSLYAEEI